jgi:aldehyde:ferredoxin oxidoreductase
MTKSYNGKVLRVDLTDGRVWVETPEEEAPSFYRTYWGGSCLGTYYLLKYVKSGTDALDPGNVLVFAGSVVSGAEAPGLARFAVLAKSPQTGCVGEALTEGYWGPELKRAGFDALVIQGKAPSPVYLSICDGHAEIRDAEALWGTDTGPCFDAIRAQLNDDAAHVACIGPAGEHLVRYASIVSDALYMNARTGMGAVMGSKNLKAIAVRGTMPVRSADPDGVANLVRQFEEHFQENFVNKAVFDAGTASFLGYLNNEGLTSTRNAHTTHWEKAGAVSGEVIHAAHFDHRVPCFHCAAACHRTLKGVEEYGVDARYGAPELDVLMAFGNGCEIGDLGTLLKANELCLRYGLDFTSTAVTTAFAMECYEKGLLTADETDGLELRFGNAEILPTLIERVARRRGIGDLLAEGVKRAAERIGPDAEGCALHVKGLELPLHDPRTKAMLGLSYALSPTGPDDMAVEHDTDYDENAPQLFMDRVATLGIWERREATDLGAEKVRMLCYLQQVFSFMDSLCLCKFAFAPCRYYSFTEMVDLVSAVSGWETSLWDLQKLGERRLAMQRVFNLRQGVSPEEDRLPQRVYEPIESGPKKGVRMDRSRTEEAMRVYYRMRDWDPNTGWPSREKLVELGLGWLSEAPEE